MRRRDSRRTMRWDDKGVSGVEYAVIIAGVAAIILLSVPAFGSSANETFCEAGSALTAEGECKPETTPGTNPGGVTNTGGGGGSHGGGGQSTTEPSGDPGTPGGGGTSVPPAANPVPSPPPNSPGWQRFNLTAIDQDQELHRLSVRTNISWFPDDWNGPVYPEQTVIDITWSPALEFDRAILGDDGNWTAELVEPGHIRMVRTGTFDTSGFQPEPELLLVKPLTQQQVTATWTVTTNNTAPITAQASHVSVPYQG